MPSKRRVVQKAFRRLLAYQKTCSSGVISRVDAGLAGSAQLRLYYGKSLHAYRHPQETRPVVINHEFKSGRKQTKLTMPQFSTLSASSNALAIGRDAGLFMIVALLPS